MLKVIQRGQRRLWSWNLAPVLSSHKAKSLGQLRCTASLACLSADRLCIGSHANSRTVHTFLLPHPLHPQPHPSLLCLADSYLVFNSASLGKLWVTFPTLGYRPHLHASSISLVIGNDDNIISIVHMSIPLTRH